MTQQVQKTQSAIVAGRKMELAGLEQMKKGFTSQAVLILDRSGSMGDHTNDGQRKIDALRTLVMDLRQQASFDQVVFDHEVEWTEDIPEPV